MSGHVVTRFEVAGELPNTSLAMEASAGTGKTWTVTSLAVRYIAETELTLPDVLLVTFTRAATAELRERVRVRIAEALAATERALVDPGWTSADVVLDRIVGDAVRSDDDGAELRVRRERLRRAAQQLDDATISTIHGFCQRMLQHAALETGMDFDAVLLEDDADLLAEIVDDHIARELRPASAAWVRYLQACGKIGRDRLTELARIVSGLPALNLLPDYTDHTADDAGCLRPWHDALTEFRSVWAGGGRETAVALVSRLHDDGAFDNPRQRTFTPNAAEKAAARVDAWLATDWPVPPANVVRDKPHDVPHFPMAYFTAEALRTKLSDGVEPPDDEVLAAAEHLLDAALQPATIFLHRAATYFWHELDRRKRQRTVLTFDDVLRRLADALEAESTGAAVRQAIRQRYRIALVDEFQDTDSVQWRIFTSLFDTDEPLVLIGDPKQAIYSFRGADVHTYVDARDTRPDRRTLQTNRRSDERYVEACNVLFGQPGAFANEDIPYHRIDAHHADRITDPGGAAPMRLRYIHRDAGELDGAGEQRGSLKKGWADRALPDDVAHQVVALLEGGITIGDGPKQARELAARDFAVLVRTNRRAHAVQQALRAAGVPAVIQRGGSVFATEEADAIQRLLAALLRPGVDRVAVAAAASTLFGRDAPTLVAQREALDDYGASGASRRGVHTQGAMDGAARTWDAWVDALTRWGARWQSHGVMPAVREAFAQDHVPERLLATPEGERRLTNVRHLVELLHSAETIEGLTPNALLDWLQTRRADAGDGEHPSAEAELRLEEDAEAVAVVTVHGSKGLQYPVVLCPDLWDGKVHVDHALTRFHDPTAAEPSAAVTLDLDVDVSSERKRRTIELAKTEARAEQLRIAYVALTRAQHRSIVWWGPFKGAATSPLASLLHGGLREPAEGRLMRAEDRLQASDDELIGDLEALATEAGDTIDVEVVHELGREASWKPGATRAPELEARVFHRGDVDRAWRRASFTSLVRGAAGNDSARWSAPDEGRDVDATAESDADARTVGEELPAGGPTGGDTADTADAPLAGFPRGAGPGTFLHDVLERVDLRALEDEQSTDTLLEAMERRHGIDEVHRPTVVEGLRAAVATPLGTVAGGAKLADLGPSDRLNELRFELPLAGGNDPAPEAFTLRSIAELLRGSADPMLHGYAERLRDPALQERVRGFLNGSIDLLARLPNGRFLVADYKSNWLGDRVTGRSGVTHYLPDALIEPMYEHHYVLQALLYLVATHRYLRWRVPGYMYDTHVAGAGYLFLRGMVGAQTPTVDGQPCGVAVVSPEGALVSELSRLLDEGRR